MTDWTSTTLVSVDEPGDRSGASDGHSRYGVYLSQRLEEFHDEDGTPLPLEEFAAAAWRVATPPVLLDYVTFRPDLQGIEAVWAENEDGTGSLAFKVSVPVRFDAFLSERRPRHPWQDWTTQYDLSTRDDTYRHPWEPTLKPGRPAVLTVSNVMVPAVGWDLPTPKHTEGRGLVEEAKQVVREVARRVNEEAGPMAAQLLGEKC
ncbi:hypothetical protein [Streptomyces sp. NPDC045470]|uniref:hypothetical protein n=1 Tax=Streptomyces sp. NPDC045470 TaxID=3155469 RepID=UPI0033DE199B